MQNDQLTIVLIIAGVLLLALVVWALTRKKRTDDLRSHYGDEYDRIAKEQGGRGAEAALREREERVRSFDIRPLHRDEQQRFGEQWREIKTMFVDSPREAVVRGDLLVTDMLRTRGYPMADFDRLYEDLTVDHADVARQFREAHTIALSGDPTTEEMRRALNHYEGLVDEMLRDAAPASQDTRDGARDIDLRDLPPAERPADGPTMPVSRRVEP
ncbi:LPXTG cell wall anchor domain-containing protein [Erythrobacteraceae bacterium CFH 75059]|uniref:LPXTG cell wall anchor domain-containing protein n=1 Tax=Qipengyuania thermophila TaxID=2509361 RepID=UPI00101FA066|nr:LPXTG cell wall anchor domain-containing protein [Qipengyuania thermophila]TCD06503.1 LPXTG cell wall anchor domain-containing protein [Erythrobacteraceae bacterium CFH 75059]